MYYAQNVYSSWIVGGLCGSIFSSSKCDWFETPICQDWFVRIILPTIINLDGNISSVVTYLATYHCLWCRNMKKTTLKLFFFLLTSHPSLPLDATYFGSLKIAWLVSLIAWKFENKGVQKLKKSLAQMQTKIWSKETVR